MKRRVMAVLIGGLLAVACGESPERMARSPAPDSGAVRTSVDFQRSVEAVLQDADRQIDQLAAKAHVEAERTRSGLDTVIQDARRQQASVHRRVERITGRGVDRSAEADIRRQLSRLQHTIEIAQLRAVRSRQEFEREIRAHVEGIDIQIDHLGRHVNEAAPPVRVDYRSRIARLERRHRQLTAQQEALAQADRAAFRRMRRRFEREVAGLRVEVRHLAQEIERAASG